MISEAQERLVHDVLDGDATEGEKAELEQLLRTNESVRARHDELNEMLRVLDAAAAAEPPAGLHDQLMSAIAAEPRYAGRSVVGAQSRRRRRAWLPVLGGFVTGAVAAGLIVASIIRPIMIGPDGGSPMSGTLAPPAVAPVTAISTASLAAGQGRVELSTYRSGSQVRLEIRSRADRPVDVEIEYPVGSLDLATLAWSRGPGARSEVVAGRVVLEGLGPGDASLGFVARERVDATLRVRAGGRDVALLHTLAPHPGE